MSIYKFEKSTIDSIEAVLKSREYDQVDLSEVTEMTGTHASLRFVMADNIFLNKSSVNIGIVNNNDDPEGRMEEYITELKSATSGNVEKLA